jgi:PqqD family protein of HPr-rel-A system
LNGPRFRLSHPGPLRAFVFDDEVVVFNAATWSTHILNASAAIVLEALGESARSTDEVARLLAEVQKTTDPAELTDQVRGLLTDLESLQLVARA